MVSTKNRKHSGRKTPDSTLLHEMSKKDIIDNCLEPVEIWNDWEDYRDGYRDVSDRTLKHSVYSRYGNWNANNWKNFNIVTSNVKITKELNIRKAKKNGKVHRITNIL